MIISRITDRLEPSRSVKSDDFKPVEFKIGESYNTHRETRHTLIFLWIVQTCCVTSEQKISHLFLSHFIQWTRLWLSLVWHFSRHNDVPLYTPRVGLRSLIHAPFSFSLLKAISDPIFSLWYLKATTAQRLTVHDLEPLDRRALSMIRRVSR